MADRLEHRASSYYPEGGDGPWRVTLIAVHRRPAARIHIYDLQSSTHLQRRVVAKIPDRSGIRPLGTQRPRLFPTLGPERETILEHRALLAIEKAVCDSGDDRLGYVRALDHVSKVGALVMEYVDQPSLGDQLRRMARHPRRGSHDIGAAFQNAGIWLRLYRELQLEGSPQREAREDLVLAADLYVRHLARHGVEPAALRNILRRFEKQVATTLPEMCPMGLAHTDFSPRNIFVGADNSVAVFDTLGFWRAPLLEDPAYFVTSMQTAEVQIRSWGFAGWWAGTEALYRRLLVGAGMDGSDRVAALSTYRVLLLLDRWAAATERQSASERGTRRRGDGFFSMQITRLLARPA